MGNVRRLLAASWLAASLAAQLPPAPVPPGNPLTPAKIALGKILFWDEQLSSDDSVACGTCHRPEHGGADPRTATSIHPGADGLFGTADDVHGTRGMQRQTASGEFAFDALFGTRTQVTRRTAGSNLGAAYHAELFWDGRATSQFVDPETGAIALAWGGALESQAVGPILNPAEMAREGRTWHDVRVKLQAVRPLALARDLTADLRAALLANPTYPALFTAAFGDSTITAVRIAFALASYQRTLIPDQTPYDAFVAGDGNALTPNQQLGLLFFETTGRCVACHTAPLFSDDLFHNLGLRPASEDAGREAINGVAIERAAFRTPSLRNAGLRPRLFHGGTSPRLDDPTQLTDPASVLNVYLAGGGVDRSALDPFLLPIGRMGLGAAELARILDFVGNGLTDARAAQGLPPFDHPTLRSAAAPAPTEYGNALLGASEPRLLTTVPSYVGNLDWKLGLAASDGPTLAYVAYSPYARTPAVLAGLLPIHVGPDLGGRFFVLNGAPKQPALATWRLPIPTDPGLRDLAVYFQLFAYDAAAPGGIAASRGNALTLQ